MRRRSRASSKLAKARSRKAKTLEVVRSSSSSAPGKETKLARLTRERDEALEQLSEALKQQTAASEVLRLISGSPGELGAVFDAMLVHPYHYGGHVAVARRSSRGGTGAIFGLA